MKNCEPFVFLPALAIDKSPGLACLSAKFSSSKTRSLEVLEARRWRRTDLTIKMFPVDGLPSRTVTLGEVATLKNEVGNDTMKAATCVAKAMFTGSEFPEIPRCHWHNIVV